MTLWGLTPPTFSHLTQEGNSMSNRITINVAPEMNLVVAQVSPTEVRVTLLCESKSNWVAHNWMDENLTRPATICGVSCNGGNQPYVRDVFALVDDSVSYTILGEDLGVAVVQAQNHIRDLAKRQELPSQKAQKKADRLAEIRRLRYAS